MIVNSHLQSACAILHAARAFTIYRNQFTITGIRNWLRRDGATAMDRRASVIARSGSDAAIAN